MKCKKLLGAICLFTTCAWAVPAQAYDSNLNDRHGYQSSSGTQYQYDLSIPSDQIRYSTDLNAQRRDQMSTSTKRHLDRGAGQYGGGIYD